SGGRMIAIKNLASLLLVAFALDLFGLSPAAAANCNFSGKWQNNYGLTISMTETGSTVTGTFSQAKTYARLGGMASFSGTVSKDELKAVFPPTKAPDPIYARGGSIDLSISADCATLTGGFTNSMVPGAPAAAIYGGLYMKRAAGPWMVVEGVCGDWTGTWTMG